jgi:hypothetical protein
MGQKKRKNYDNMIITHSKKPLPLLKKKSLDRIRFLAEIMFSDQPKELKNLKITRRGYIHTWS